MSQGLRPCRWICLDLYHVDSSSDARPRTVRTSSTPSHTAKSQPPKFRQFSKITGPKSSRHLPSRTRNAQSPVTPPPSRTRSPLSYRRSPSAQSPDDFSGYFYFRDPDYYLKKLLNRRTDCEGRRFCVSRPLAKQDGPRAGFPAPGCRQE